MKTWIIFCLLIISLDCVLSQESDTIFLHFALSKGDTLIYRRIVSFNTVTKLYEVKDFFENGQIQMETNYSSIDKFVKEDCQCNYRSNTKEGQYEEWYSNGQLKYAGNFKNGKRDGKFTEWYKNGQKQAEEQWKNGQLNGNTKYWAENGELQYDLTFIHGENNDQKTARYDYLTYLPEKYNLDSLQRWPLIIYLHGGSDRGNNLKKLYSSGIPDQIYRGRNFPFIIISPQCPLSLRWETENWFEPFYKEIVGRYRIDTNRIYLTGFSLGGSGTWYLAIKYSKLFTAIAPMSGFTSHNEFIYRHVKRLNNMHIWAFHGKMDLTVPYEETERMVQKIQKKNKHILFTSEPNIGHGIHWNIYPDQDLYDWFLKQKK